MSEQLERAKILHREIQKALITEWDPIGIGKCPDAQNEYDSYIPTIYKMLISKKPKHEIFDYLWWVETEYMGLTGNRQQTEKLVEHLLDLLQDRK